MPKQSADYEQMSDFVLSRIGSIVGDAIKAGQNKIFIRTNLKRSLPLENINKVAGPFVEAWALEKFEAIGDDVGNRYDLKYVGEKDLNYNPALGTGQLQIRDIHYVEIAKRTTWQFLKMLDKKYIKSRGESSWKKMARKNEWIKG